MKGDISTLRKICRYASSVMLAGTVALGAALACTLALGAGAAAGIDGFEETLSAWTGGGLLGVSGIAAFAELSMILALGLFTVLTVYKVMKAMQTEHSPFETENVDSMRVLAKTYLMSAFLLAVTEWIAHGNLPGTLFLFFGSVMVAVVVYCLALAFRYGCLLQKESDETLRGADDDHTQA